MVEGCTRAMKYILVGFNFLVLIIGAICIGFGAWALASDNGADELRDLTGSELYRGVCIIIIVGGCIIFALAFLGFCGALMENRVLLGFYFVIMLLLLILFVVLAVLGFFFKDDIRDELEKEMKKTLVNDYGVNDDVTAVWDKVQERFECCGVSGNQSSQDSWFLYQQSEFFKRQNHSMPNMTLYVPVSCCREDSPKCYGLSNETQPIWTFTDKIVLENPFLYEQGCVDAVEDKITDHIIPIGAIAIIVIVIMFLCVIFAVSVCVAIGKRSMAV